jgi:hypothetical protein
MRAFCLMRFSLTRVAHFGNDKKSSEDCSATKQIDRLPQGNESCRTATQVGFFPTPADSVPSTHPA